MVSGLLASVVARPVTPQPILPGPAAQVPSSKPLAVQPVCSVPVSWYFQVLPNATGVAITGEGPLTLMGAGDAERLPRASLARTV